MTLGFARERTRANSWANEGARHRTRVHGGALTTSFPHKFPILAALAGMAMVNYWELAGNSVGPRLRSLAAGPTAPHNPAESWLPPSRYEHA
jgi:hypothetical protein